MVAPLQQSPRTLDELLRTRAEQEPDVGIAAFPTSSDVESYQVYTARQLDEFTERAATAYARKISPRTHNSPEKVVALLGASDLDYVVTQFALGRLGLTVLFLSNRLSAAAIASLIASTNCVAIVGAKGFEVLSSSIQELCPNILLTQMLEHQDYSSGLLKGASIKSCRPLLDQDFETTKCCHIIHSSGSTGFPKPIRNIHKNFLHNVANNFNMVGFITLPLFHNHGISSFYRALTSGKVLYFYNPRLPLTAKQLGSAFNFLSSKLEIFYGVPYALKILADTPTGIELLSMFKIVMFGGSSCPDDLGDRLVAAGVNLVSHYGATEVGQLMTSFRPEGDDEWNYVRPSPELLRSLQWVPHGDALECVIRDGWKSKVVSNQPDGSYATRDLFVPHPTKPDRFKYVGRLDDWIILVSGEKINPVQYEHTIRTDPHVAEAIVFGVGQVSAGLIIVPNEGFDVLTENEYLDLVQPTVDSANERAEYYAQIDRAHIRVLKSAAITDCPKTDKGTVIRAAFYKKYATLFDSIYEDAERIVSEDLRTLTLEETREWLVNSLCTMLKIESHSKVCPQPDSDFFAIGLDSLSAYRLYTLIIKTLDLGGNTAKIAANVCFDYPNVNALSSHLIDVREGHTQEKVSELESMEHLIRKYGTFTATTSEVGSKARHSKAPRRVLLTGVTGSLGAYLLRALLDQRNVEVVYCLNRADSHDLADARTITSMTARKLDYDGTRVKSFAGDVTKVDFGLEKDLFTSLLNSVDLVIHNAWPVNFNMGVSSFESQIHGVRNLLDFCSMSFARFYFVSSVSAAVRSGNPVHETSPDNVANAQEMGYARSKLVAETLCHQAREADSVDACVFRVGQIVADTQQGQWNATEAIPLMIRSAITIGALPGLDDTLSWLPTDMVAQTMIELCHNEAGSSTGVYHVVNPKTMHWTADFLPMLRNAGLSFKVVGQHEWLELLSRSEQDPEINPTIKLLDFFSKKYGGPVSTRPAIVFETTKAEEQSPTLKSVQAPDQALINKMLHFWRSNSWPRTG